MAKINGLNVRLYVEGYDLSGDANAVSGLGYTNMSGGVFRTVSVPYEMELLGEVTITP